MTNNSLKAYFDKSNQRKFKSHRAMLIRELSKNPSQHSYQLASKLQLTNEAVKKRINDLMNDKIIEICGKSEYYGNTQSLYKIKDQLSMFKLVKPLTLKQYLKRNYSEIYEEYESYKIEKMYKLQAQ